MWQAANIEESELSATPWRGAHDDVRDCARTLKLVLLTSCLVFQPGGGPETQASPRFVIFYEIGLSSPAVALADREVRAVLDNSLYQIELYPGYLETTRFRFGLV